ncbi:MAG: NAD(+) synthase [Clostridia bacterium]|nr:NAD(+) synthase [Clostridia bacterium]
MLEKEKLKKEMENAIEWIRSYVKKSGANGIVIGNSGGKDSATVLAMATKAIGKENVIAVSMPCFSNLNDFEDAKLVTETFGVKFITVDLSNSYKEMEKEINLQLVSNLSKEAMINIKPRLRMTTLYGIAQTLGYLVIGTGNLCEAMVGYTTKWGDNSSDFNPIGNFTVEEVLEIGRMLGVPDKILQKAPCDGLGGLTDEEKMGIKYRQIAEMIETGNTEEDAKQEIVRRYQNSKHKRSLVPVYTFERKNFLKEEERK